MRFLTVARVVRAHGIKGELSCEIVTDFPERFRKTTRVYLNPPPRRPGPVAREQPADGVPAATEEATTRPREYAVERARVVPHALGARLVLGLDAVNDREGADALRDWLVQVPEDEAWTLPEGRYYWHQIVGLAVVTTDGRRLGSVVEILETGANDVYVVKREGEDLLLPAIKDVVKEIAPERGEMVVELLPGME